MAISVMCPNLCCKKILMVPGDMRGRRVRCYYCGTQFVIPKTQKRRKRKQPSVTVPAEPKESK